MIPVSVAQKVKRSILPPGDAYEFSVHFNSGNAIKKTNFR